MTVSDPRALLRAMFDAAVAAADPMSFIPDALPPKPPGRVLVLGAGKASARMAEAVEREWGRCEGLVVTRYGHGRPTRGIEVVEASHPVPDAAGAAATARMLERARGLGEGDLCLFLISGGASALLCAPRPPLTLADKIAVNAALLDSGLPIGTMNAVRRELSEVKGGRLAAAAFPARTLALALSDVPGDVPAWIGSGPTVGGRADPAVLRGALDRLGDALPEAARRLLAGPPHALAADDPRLSRCETRVAASPARSLAAAADVARAAGVPVRDLGEVEGEAREVGRGHAAMALEAAGPFLILSGGELTVTRAPGADGTGGPNAEYVLALAIALGGAPNVWAMAGDTDGIDGAAEVAGAIAGPGTLARALAAGRDPADALARHDAHGFFAATGDQTVTGPTLTNVNDVRAVLVL